MNDRFARILRRVPIPALIVALHAIVFGAMLVWSWRKWPDPLIDFGRELYVPWQLTRGRVLYQDIASLFGPLSPYLNALWFRTFGVSLLTLAWCNIAIFAAMVAGIYHLIRVSTDRLTAAAAGLTTIALFGFSQYVSVGNYNFVTPYSHEATHGLALSVAMLVCLHRGLIAGRWEWFAAAGLAFGLVNLTKPEVAVAAAAAVVIGLAVVGVAGLRDLPWLFGRVSLFVVGGALPPLAFFLYFLAHMAPGDAARAVAGAWAALDRQITANPFYVVGMGLDAPLANATRMLVMFVGFLAYVAGAVLVARSRPGRMAFLVLTILAVSLGTFPRLLLPIAATSLVMVFLLMRRRSADSEDALRLSALAMWSAFGLALLAKIALNARINHYGFYLALPATVTGVVLICWVVPEWLRAWGLEDRRRGVRQIALWTLAAAAAPYLGVSYGWYAMKTVPVGSGADRFLAASSPDRWEGAALREAMATIERAGPPDATIAVLPEGVMLNYLLRRDSPLRVVTLMPPEIAAFGEDAVLRSLEAAPPDFVVLVQKDTTEYGVPPFGTDARYGERTVAWVRARYRPFKSIAQGRMEILARAALEMFVLQRY